MANAKSRDPTIDEFAKRSIDQLLTLYYDTDPAMGNNTEEQKWDHAREAIRLFDRLRNRLIGWADNHIAGSVAYRQKDEVCKALERVRGSALSKDAHELEFLGNQIARHSRSNTSSTSSAVVIGEIDHVKLADDQLLLRAICSEILELQANDSVWQDRLRHALAALDAGKREPFVELKIKGRRGRDPYLLDYACKWAIAHVYAKWGEGHGKGDAEAIVGDILGVSPETLRTWEKYHMKLEKNKLFWEAARLCAGPVDVEQDSFKNEINDKYGSFDGLQLIGCIAEYQYGADSSSFSLDNLGRLIKDLRAKQKQII